MLRLLHLQLGTLTALACRLYVAAVAIERETHAYHEAVDGFALLGIAAVAEGYAGQPLTLLHLKVHVGGAQGGLRHCHVGIRCYGEGAILLEVDYRLVVGQLG